MPLTEYAEPRRFEAVEAIRLYRCFCDVQRLRVLNLLLRGPLCVCHLMKILGEEQVKMSKQLAYMKRLGLLEVDRHAQWRIYRLREPRSPLLVENLKCLQDVAGEDFKFAEDLRERDRILGEEAVSGRPSPCRATA